MIDFENIKKNIANLMGVTIEEVEKIFNPNEEQKIKDGVKTILNKLKTKLEIAICESNGQYKEALIEVAGFVESMMRLADVQRPIQARKTHSDHHWIKVDSNTYYSERLNLLLTTREYYTSNDGKKERTLYRFNNGIMYETETSVQDIMKNIDDSI